VTERRPPGRTIAVEEVRLDATDVAADTPTGPPRAGDRRRRAALLVAAVVAALAAGATTVAVVDPGDDQATVPTSTSTPPAPVLASATDERRVLLAEPPAGFGLVAVRQTGGAHVQARATAVLHARPGASIDDDEWLLAVCSPPAARFPLDIGFRRPSHATTVGAAAAVVGRGPLGDETTAFDHPEGRVTLTARGLEPGTTEALARRVRIDHGVVHLAGAELAAGLVAHGTWRVPRGLAIARDLAADTGEPDGWHAAYRAGDGAAIEVAASAITSDEAEAVAPISRFLLADAAEATVRGHEATVGRAGGSIWVVWTEGSTLVTVAGTGIDAAAAVEVASSVRLASDAGWDEPAWLASAQLQGGDLTMRIVGRGALSGATSWWDVTAAIDGTEVVWALRTGHNVAESIAERAPITSPLTLIATGRQKFTRDPIGADAGEISDWYAVALAVGDARLAGATLRLTVDGPTPVTIERVLGPVRGIDGHVVAAVAVPWTQHYTAEVIGADGAVLATAADTDSA
jgi:hypothetical protein